MVHRLLSFQTDIKSSHDECDDNALSMLSQLLSQLTKVCLESVQVNFFVRLTI